MIKFIIPVEQVYRPTNFYTFTDDENDIITIPLYSIINKEDTFIGFGQYMNNPSFLVKHVNLYNLFPKTTLKQLCKNSNINISTVKDELYIIKQIYFSCLKEGMI